MKEDQYDHDLTKQILRGKNECFYLEPDQDQKNTKERIASLSRTRNILKVQLVSGTDSEKQ